MNLVPNAVFDQHIIVLGKTRSGKSSVMRWLVEKLLDEQKPVCIVDPKGDWWGIKSSASGKEAGYPVVIFGGEHADIPLNAKSGATVAELAATENRPCVIDLGGWMPGARTEFWIDFASKFFILTRGRRWLVVDEVHNFAPKGKIMDPSAGKMLHWSNRLASEGLGKGVALIAASQRPQKVHNDFLTSCETLVAMRVIHKADRDALKDWIDGCGDSDAGQELLTTIAGMQRGEAWAWSPEAHFGPKRMQFPLFKTYDSFKPQDAQHPAKLKGWADVDLAEVKAKMDVVVKEAEANDPARLNARIRELEAVAKSPRAAVAATVDRRAITQAVGAALVPWQRLTSQMQKALKQASDSAGRIASEALKAVKLPTEILGGEIHERKESYGRDDSKATVSNGVRSRETSHPRPEKSNGDLKRPLSRILAALRQFEAIRVNYPSRAMVASWLGVKAGTGSFKNYLSELRTQGLILDHAPDRLELTDHGRAHAPGIDAPATTEELLERAKTVFGGTQAKILDIIHGAYPDDVEREAIAASLGISAETGSFKNYLSELRVAGMLVDAPGKRVKCADWMFL